MAHNHITGKLGFFCRINKHKKTMKRSGGY